MFMNDNNVNAVDNSIERTPMLKKHTFNKYRDVVSTQRYIPFTVEKKELKNGCIRKDDYQDIIRIKAEVKLQKILENNLKYKERSNDKKNEEWLITLKDCNTIDSFLDYLKANYRFYLKNIPWERGYNAVCKISILWHKKIPPSFHNDRGNQHKN